MQSPASSDPEVAVILIALGDDPRVAQAIASLPATPLEIALVTNGAPPPSSPHNAPSPDIPASLHAFLAPSEAPRTISNRKLTLDLRRPENPGFAAAFNEALARTQAPFVLSLNPDAALEPGALEAALAALESDPKLGAIAFRLLRPNRQTLDSAGIRLGPLRLAKDRGMGRPAADRFLHPEDVDAACGAAALFRRSALESVQDAHGVMDERFFAYKEDVDLGWRLRRHGHRVRYLPTAIALHERGWKERSRANVPAWLRVLSLRNRWLMIFKNERGPLAPLRLLPPLLCEPLLALRLLLTEPQTLAAYRAIWNLKHKPRGVR